VSAGLTASAQARLALEALALWSSKSSGVRVQEGALCHSSRSPRSVCSVCSVSGAKHCEGVGGQGQAASSSQGKGVEASLC